MEAPSCFDEQHLNETLACFLTRAGHRALGGRLLGLTIKLLCAAPDPSASNQIVFMWHVSADHPS